MRRTAFYMGRTFSSRHLQRVHSPLLTGYVNLTSFTQSMTSGPRSPLAGSVGTCAASALVCGAPLSSAITEALVKQLQGIDCRLLSQILADLPTNFAVWGMTRGESKSPICILQKDT